MIRKINAVMLKNLRILLHSKISAMILIVGPILLISLFGFGLRDSGIRNIQTNVYISEKTEITDNFVTLLNERSFIITETKSVVECIEGVTKGDKTLCIEIRRTADVPLSLINTLNAEQQKDIGYRVHLHVDFTKQRVVWGIIAKVEGAVSDFSNMMRERAIQKIQNDLATYSVSMQEMKRQIDTFSESLRILGNGADELQKTLEKDIEEFDNLLDGLRKNINTIPETDITKNRLLKLGASYNALNNAWIGGNYRQVPQHLDTFKRNVRDARDDVLLLKIGLENAESKLQYFKKSDLNYFLNPIPLTYESISEKTIREAKNLGC